MKLQCNIQQPAFSSHLLKIVQIKHKSFYFFSSLVFKDFIMNPGAHLCKRSHTFELLRYKHTAQRSALRLLTPPTYRRICSSSLQIKTRFDVNDDVTVNNEGTTRRHAVLTLTVLLGRVPDYFLTACDVVVLPVLVA